MSDQPMTIVELRAENVKRIKSVRIHPDAHGNMVVVGGRNAAGKSSVLDAIAMALGGKDQVPSEPIRRGADRAEIVVDLGDLVVKRTFTAGGGGTLIVSNRDGARFQSPQTLLDSFVGRLAFDPLAFSREKPARKAEILRDLVGLDLASLDARRAEIYAERAATNKRATAMRHQLAAMPFHQGQPIEPVSAARAAESLRQAQERNREIAALRNGREVTARSVQKAEQDVDDLRRRLQEAETLLDGARGRLAKFDRDLDDAVDVDIAPLRAAVADIDQTNAKVRDNQRYMEAEAATEAIERVSEDLTAEIGAIDQRKAAAIAAAPMPVDGLGFGADGTVTLNGIPLEQSSAAEQLRVSVAIGLAANPRLRVLLVRDASLLDRESMRILADMAAAHSAQLWVERVMDPDDPEGGCSVVIEDGEVLAAPEFAAGASERQSL